MPGRGVETLHLTLTPSAWLTGAVLIAYAAGAAVLVALALARPWLLLGLPVLAGAAAYAYRRARRRTPASIVRLRCPASGDWSWQRGDGAWREGAVLDARVLGPWVVILHLRERGRRWRSTRCVIGADSLDADSHRRLRVRATVMTLPQPAPERS